MRRGGADVERLARSPGPHAWSRSVMTRLVAHFQAAIRAGEKDCVGSVDAQSADGA
jgi:hypothetical protein